MQALGKHVIIAPVKKEESKGPIAYVEAEGNIKEAEVVSVGDKVELVELKQGDRVLYIEGTVNLFSNEGKEFNILLEDGIVAKL